VRISLSDTPVRAARMLARLFCGSAVLLALTPPASAGWLQVWSDEFNGSSLDTNKWQHNLGDGCSTGFTRPAFNNTPLCNFGTLEREYNRAQNVMIGTEGTEKFLRITARTNTDSNLRCALPTISTGTPGTPNQGMCPYTSGRIDNLNGIGQKLLYGKVEARIRLPSASGIWPAFWMLGTATKDGTAWPRVGEIDIMEHVNSSRWVYGTLHWHDPAFTSGYRNIWAGNSTNGFMQWPRSSGNASSIGLGSQEWGFSPRTVAGGTSNLALPSMDAANWFTNWHTYSIEWSPTYVRWSVDGFVMQETPTTPHTLVGNSGVSTEEFHRPFYIILNLAVGGDWPEHAGLTGNDHPTWGNPATATYPQNMDVDYVRVYQHKPEITNATTWYEVRNRATGKCVDNRHLFTQLPVPGSQWFASVYETTCATQHAQHWALVPVSGATGYYKVVNRYQGAGAVLQVQDKVPVGSGFGRGIVPEIWKYGFSSTQVTNGQWSVDADKSNQEWSLGYQNGYYTFVNRETRACLTGAAFAGGALKWAACDGSQAQQFALTVKN
jgi:beta-glucanase (GH16 family)